MIETTAQRLTRIMTERRLRQSDILRLAEPYCRELGLTLSKSDLSQFVNGKVKPGSWKLRLLSKALDVSEEWLAGQDVPRGRKGKDLLPGNIIPYESVTRYRVPLIGAVAAGEPIMADEMYGGVEGPIEADYALQVEGDSMDPMFMSGDIVYIHAQADVNDGQIGVVVLDDTATLKRIYHIPNGLQLVSINPKYAPMIKTYEEYNTIRILGLAVGFTRMF